MKVLAKKLHPDAILPKRSSEYSAGYDLYACIDAPIVIQDHETKKIPTGLSFAIPPGWFGGIFARSGLATREGLRPANCVGVIDSDYRGEVIVALHNDMHARYDVVERGQRIAQLILLPCEVLEFEEVDDLPESERGEGGFGSTGK